MKRAMVLLMTVVALLASAACQSDNKVGNKALLDFKEQANNRLGETTTTTAATTTTTARGAVTTTTKPKTLPGAAASTSSTARSAGAPSATTATTAVAKATQTVREIDIYDDDATQPLDPQVQTAYLGSTIRWVNKGKADRVVKADSGQFASPTIHPGASWDYTANTAGIFAYSDDTRPYVHGELRVSKP